MDKILVINVLYSSDDGLAKAPNIKGASISTYDIYVRNSFMSLISTKKSNEDVDCAIVTNRPLMAPYDALFRNNGIRNIIVPFDEYCVPKDFVWSYAFYKLCALKHIVYENDYDYDILLLLDTDTLVMRPLDYLWRELGPDRVFLYNLHRQFMHPVRNEIEKIYFDIYGTHEYVEQWGG
ncbi:MAG: hypothetical protein LUG99_09360 [Lachnospiraceae bacterium]|nr:hypothetical protein [Lachnospiraceae bacterium]